MIVFAAGIAGVLAYLLAAGFGLDVIYGGPVPQPQPAIAPATMSAERGVPADATSFAT